MCESLLVSRPSQWQNFNGTQNFGRSKTYGCNHITCNCGAHFCFIDGLEFSADRIYEHLSEAHGGYGGGDYEDDDDDDDY